MSSINNTLERTRKPRVHIKYEVETENGTVEKELPFVVGVMGDFTGNAPAKETRPLKERNFIHINRDNFNQVMNHLSPGVRLHVANTLKNDNSEFSVNVQFKTIQDFEPTAIVEQVPQLKKLMDTRNQLRDLLSKSERSDELEAILEQVLQDPSKLSQLAAEIKTVKNKG